MIIPTEAKTQTPDVHRLQLNISDQRNLHLILVLERQIKLNKEKLFAATSRYRASSSNREQTTIRESRYTDLRGNPEGKNHGERLRVEALLGDGGNGIHLSFFLPTSFFLLTVSHSKPATTLSSNNPRHSLYSIAAARFFLTPTPIQSKNTRLKQKTLCLEIN
ncbi:hypothetical protein KSP39_PZI022149 [Platanthera zijinensis]|uniref:Uncharacterized protein n=1 Tax=Platanthera zijinensis TaxID=2320716 RepID=A0AAP0FWV9_9ASPA